MGLGEMEPSVRGPFKDFRLYPEVGWVLLEDFKQRINIKFGGLGKSF